MSDLAPFVASQLRDKVVTDLQEENQRLRNQVDNAHKVEITGPRGQPVYATGKFQEGCRRRGQSSYWEVDCVMAMERVPISMFQENIEIHLGGIHFVSSTPSDRLFNGLMDEKDWDGDDRKQILCRFNSRSSEKTTTMDMRIEGWPKSHWAGVQERDFSTRLTDNPLNLSDFLKNEVSVLYPDATVSIPAMSFLTEGVSKVMNNLGIPPVSEEDIEEQNGFFEKISAIAMNLRLAGNIEFGAAFADKMRDLQVALYMLDLDEVNDDMHAVLQSLILIQIEAVESGEDFLSLVQSRYDISDEKRDYVLDHIQRAIG